MDADTKRKLIQAAAQAREQARAHHSNFPVGAALLATSPEEKIITGANVESDSYGLTCCAERVALFQAATSGYGKIIAVAVVADAERPTPCGACRQLLWEYAPDAVVLVANSKRRDEIQEYTVAELLPAPFVLARK